MKHCRSPSLFSALNQVLQALDALEKRATDGCDVKVHMQVQLCIWQITLAHKTGQIIYEVSCSCC